MQQTLSAKPEAPLWIMGLLFLFKNRMALICPQSSFVRESTPGERAPAVGLEIPLHRG
jgi:hypothetical protein